MSIFTLDYINILLNESSAKSSLSKDFKKKDGYNFQFLDIFSPEAKKYYKYTELDSFKDLNEYGNGVIAINRDTKDYAGYLCIYRNLTWEDDKGNEITGNWINPIEVAKKYRGYGLGSTLLNLAQDKYKANLIEVNDDNEIALKMYKDHGWKYIANSFNKGCIIMSRGNNYTIKKGNK